MTTDYPTPLADGLARLLTDVQMNGWTPEMTAELRHYEDSVRRLEVLGLSPRAALEERVTEMERVLARQPEGSAELPTLQVDLANLEEEHARRLANLDGALVKVVRAHEALAARVDNLYALSGQNEDRATNNAAGLIGLENKVTELEGYVQGRTTGLVSEGVLDIELDRVNQEIKRQARRITELEGGPR